MHSNSRRLREHLPRTPCEFGNNLLPQIPTVYQYSLLRPGPLELGISLAHAALIPIHRRRCRQRRHGWFTQPYYIPETQISSATKTHTPAVSASTRVRAFANMMLYAQKYEYTRACSPFFESSCARCARAPIIMHNRCDNGTQRYHLYGHMARACLHALRRFALSHRESSRVSHARGTQCVAQCSAICLRPSPVPFCHDVNDFVFSSILWKLKH